MKIIARIAAAAVAAIASVFVAAPALAHDGEHIAPISHAGEPLQVGAILICGFILLAIVLLVAQGVGSLFEKK
ncbi:MAG: hypothetical protein KDB25_08265 [Leucobacter sp.]|nr:hypothetical protein [Leucobacter sp.]